MRLHSRRVADVRASLPLGCTIMPFVPWPMAEVSQLMVKSNNRRVHAITLRWLGLSAATDYAHGMHDPKHVTGLAGPVPNRLMLRRLSLAVMYVLLEPCV
jgi:hypothetical protein